jgi:phosphatidate cytidylyltransferase
LLLLALALPLRAADVARSGPGLPEASPAWTASFAGVAAVMVARPSGLPPGLWGMTALDFASPQGRAALFPLGAELERPQQAALRADLAALARLTPERRAEVLAALDDARARAGIAAARALRDASAAIPDGPQALASADALKRQAEGFSLYGEPAQAALSELSARVDSLRRARLSLSDPFGTKADDAAVVAGQENLPSTGGPRLSKPRSDFAKRAATAAVLVPGIIGLAHVGGAPFAFLTAGISAGALWEYGGILKAGGRPVQRWLTLAGGLALSAAVILGWPLGLTLAAVAAAVALRELLRTDHSLERAAFTLAGAVLLGVLPAYLAPLRALPHGQALAFLAFGAAWATDTLAYLVGRRFGRHKLAPQVSPKKTWEGAIGGLAGALLVGILFAATGALPWAAALAIAAVLGTLGQASGLFSSLIKRANGVKDSGTLLPGHGGVLDRFDTFVLAAAVVYALARVLA